MTAPLVVVEGLTIRAPRRVLIEDVGLEVRPRRVTALVGPSGAGKSLTARACMAVLDVDPGIVRGSLRYPLLDAGKDWFADVLGRGMRAQRRLLRQTRHLRGAYVTYSPQAATSALNPARTVGRQLQLAVRRRQDRPVSEAAAIRSLLEEVGLSPDTASALPGELSGGMAQRAALAIAIAPLPRMVIADEPETGLDPVLRRSVIELLVDVTRSHGAGLLLISHHQATVDRIADDVVQLHPPQTVEGAA